METFSMWLKPELIWFLVGLLLLLIEFMNPGIIILFFGLGAWIVALICLFFDISLNAQLAIFLLTSLIMLVLLRRWFRLLFKKKILLSGEDDTDESEFVGKRAIVTRKISPHIKGKVEFRGSYWDAESAEEIDEKIPVEIIGKDNITLIVKRL